MTPSSTSVHPVNGLPPAGGAIAVVGMSGRYPGGANTPDLLWDLLRAGRDGVTEARGDRWDLGYHHPDAHRPGRVYTRAGGFLDRVDAFDADFFGLSPREVRQVDPQQRLLLELAWEAHEDAGIAPRSRAGSETGVFVGISSNDYGQLAGQSYPDAYSNTGSAFSIAANRISYVFDFHGPSVAVDTACSSSLVCVHQACVSLLAGECNAALAGGVSILSHIRPWLGFAKASMLSPDGRCKSFDASGNGYVRSEGGGLVLLKRLADAERDGDRILGVILATGVNSDGRTMGLSMPNGDAQEALLRKVYAQANVDPATVFYVEAHGTGTAVGDPIECGALGRVIGAPRANGGKLHIGSVKSNIGHLEAASGIAGLTKVLLALKHRQLPGNLHFATPNPKIEFDAWKLDVVTATTPLPAEPVTVGVNSFGFGGTNAHLAIREYRNRPTTSPSSASPDVLVLSAHSEAGLRAVAQQYADLLRSSPERWPETCAAAATTRSMLRHRLAVAGPADAAVARLEQYVNGQSSPRAASGTAGDTDVPIAFVFSGNGPQWWGMGRELLLENDVFRAEIEAVDAIFAPLAGWSIVAEMAKPEADSRMALTEVAQPMLFALQLGLTQVLRSQGIRPAAVVGHSVGEAAAAWACGALTREQATRVIYHRSAEQAKTAGTGRMAALGVSDAEAVAAMLDVPGWLELAATNSPGAVTVAGDGEALQALVGAMTVAGKFARTLPLNYPFHTRAMEPIRDGLLAALADLSLNASEVRFISTVEGTELPGTALDADYWYRNVREPVRFAQAVRHLLTDVGIALFVEVGPHPVLKDYVLQAAKAADVAAVAFPTLRRPGRQGPEPESDNLWTAICTAHAHGAADLESLSVRPTPPPPLPLYPWQRERHWRGGVPLPDVFEPLTRDHPLLGHRVPSVDGIWENTADTNQLRYLTDHVVQQAVLFPAAGYVECMLQAGQLTFGKGTVDVEDFEILRPMAIAAHGDPVVQTAIDARDGTVEVSSRADRDAADWTTHARGRISRSDAKPAESIDLAAIAARTPVTVTAQQHYAGASRRGMDYGPLFQGVARVRLSPADAVTREALADIVLPAVDVDGYLAHPSLLDACVQVLITLIGQTEPRDCSTIPVQIGRVRSLAPLTADMRCHVAMVRESARSAVADFRITDQAGTVLMAIDGARCQKVDFNQAGPTPLTSEWWRPDPAGLAYAAPAPLPAPADVAAALDVPALLADEDRPAHYATFRPAFDRLIAAYAARAVAAVQAEVDKPSPKRDQAKLLARLTELASPHESPAALWRDLFERYPRCQTELLLAATVGDVLADRLHGDDTADVAGLVDQLRDTAPYQVAYNTLARATVAALVARWPADRPMRVLELNGGGGGLAAWLLPALPPQRADYLFTDPSDAAVARAEHRLAAHRVARFAAADPARDLAEQGVPAGYFDLVIAPHLASGRSAKAALTRLQAVMAPGAHLLAFRTNGDPFADVILNQPASVTAADLTAAGFDAIATIDDASLAGQTPDQSILLARNTKSAALLPAEPVPPRRWMLVVDAAERDGRFVQRLAAAFDEHHHPVAVRTFAGDTAAVRDAVAADLRAHPVDEVVYLNPVATRADLLVAQLAVSQVAVGLVQAMEAVRQDVPAQVTFVTRGAFPTANGQPPIDPGQASIWGLARVIGNELSGLSIRSVDLHTKANDDKDAVRLSVELLNRDAETEVQLSAGFRYVNRERLNTMADEARNARTTAAAYALDFLPSGGLDSLYLRAASQTAPGTGQVEIAVRAAGLNFRDVLWSMGMLPEEAVEHGFSGPTIGMECAGEIVRVGPGVTNVKPGDRVVAFASNCFASHVTTDAGSVAVIPDALGFAGAATIPTAFLTAYYALDHLARLEPGEVVLIHGAAGGVGLAALQVAKLNGAIVIGTAGSLRKRAMLSSLGVDHVLSSRSLEFADEVMRLTGGKGVDVVLNSLAGEAITKSLKCLRPFGRFLEIGKRDLYANSRIGLRPFRNNLSYFGIDADTLLIERPDLARRLFQRVVDHFAHGELRPIPFQEIPITRAAEAFRAMQQSRHVGKLVITTAADAPAVVPTTTVIRPDVTYLVTGGLGGFGLATAKWLVEQGATALALLSRRGAVTDEARAGVAMLAAMGATVRPFAVDVADAAALATVLATVRAEMPPLAGVIHSAAVIEDAPVLNVGAEQLDRVYRPKLLGAWNLHQATLADRLDLFVLYSSSSAVVGNPGQAAYVAANLYLDALALHRRSIGLPALAVGWGAIKDAGFLTRHEAVAGMLKTRTGLDATPADEALADLGRLLAVGASRVSVARFDLQRLGHMLPGARVPRFEPIIPKGAEDALATEETLGEQLKAVPPVEQRDFVLARVRGHAARVLGTSSAQVDVTQPLSALGLDSLMAVELAGGLERDLGQPVSVMQMLTAGSLMAIAELVMRTLGLSLDEPQATPALQEVRA